MDRLAADIRDVGLNVERWVAEWERSLEEFQAELASAADQRRRVSLDADQVERFARSHGAPYHTHAYRRGDGRVVWAQVAETLQHRVAAEINDLLRLSPELSRCPRCRRVQTHRCGAYLVRDGLIVETCDGRTRPPTLSEQRRRLRNSMRQKALRYARDYGAEHPYAKEAKEELHREFPPQRRGPAPREPRSNIQASQPARPLEPRIIDGTPADRSARGAR